MGVVGLITEYNPFHKGHEYHIKKAKELTGASNAIVIMSGNYVQRGTPAFLDKYTRTSIALNHGADLVFELPLPFSCSSAEYFALSAVTTLNKTGIVDYICFGAETDNLNLLEMISKTLVDAKCNEEHALNTLIKKLLKTGVNYASARSLAICEYFNDGSIDDIVNKPNNILAIEYLKALAMLNSDIKPVIIKRTLASYHHDNSNDYMYSASSLRSNIDNNDTTSDLWEFDSHYKDAFNKNFPILEKDFDNILAEKLIYNIHNNMDLSIYNNIDTQLANRITNVFKESNFKGWNDFAMKVKNKNITYTAISRGLLSIMLGIKKSDFEEYLDNDICNFLRILGFKSSSSHLLNQIKNNGCITTFGQLSELNDNANLNPTDLKLINNSIYADEIYNSITALKFNSEIPNEYRRKLIIIKKEIPST